MASTAAEHYGWMTDESAESMLLTARTSDLLSQMMIAEAHDEMEDGLFEGVLPCQDGANIGVRGSMPLVDVMAKDYQTIPASSIPSRTEPYVKIWKFAGGRQGHDAKYLSGGMVMFSCQLV